MKHILSLRRHQEVKVVGIFLLAVVLVLGLSSYPAAADTVPVHILRVDGVILPETVDYVDAGVTKAEEANAAVCIIELNTPGGLLDASAKIVSRIMDAKVPIVVYVSPVRAWGADAGTYITLAAHVAAMAPGTVIGAATPSAGGDLTEDEWLLMIELTAKWMEAIAEQRGRNIEEARLTVTQAKSFSHTEALELNLIDLTAESLEDLVSQINGWRVLVSGEEVNIDTTDYVLVRHRSFRTPVNWALIGGVVGAVAVVVGLAVLLLRRRRTSAS